MVPCKELKQRYNKEWLDGLNWGSGKAPLMGDIKMWLKIQGGDSHEKIRRELFPGKMKLGSFRENKRVQGGQNIWDKVIDVDRRLAIQALGIRSMLFLSTMGTTE